MEFDDETKTIMCTNKKDAFFLITAIEYYLNPNSRIMPLAKVRELLEQLPVKEDFGFKEKGHLIFKYNIEKSLIILDFSYELYDEKLNYVLEVGPICVEADSYNGMSDATRIYNALKQIKNIKN